MTTINISRKSSGNYFIGQPSNNRQELVATFDSYEDVVSFFSKMPFAKVIKSEYSRSTTYYQYYELVNPKTWEKLDKKAADAVAKFEASIAAYKRAEEIKEAERKAIIAEADSIGTDEQFATDVNNVFGHGAEKSRAMASAFKALLQRKSIEKVNTDFWQVFRVLKARV